MLVKLFSIMVAVSLVVIMGSLGYMVVDRAVPIEIISGQTPVLKAKPGGLLEFDVRFIQHKRCHVLTERRLIGPEGRIFLLPPMEFRAGIGPIGREQKTKISIRVPIDMPPGDARYESVTFYKCNILHSIWPVVSPYTTVSFEVSS